jgi:hypothetical protein
MRVALLAGILIAAAAMTAALEPAASSRPSIIEPLEGAPDFRVEAPSDRAAVSSLGVRVVISVTNFTLDLENYGRDPIPGHGHLHYYVDGLFAGTAWTEAFSIGPFTPGSHRIDIGLRNNDHTFLDPDVSRSFSVVGVEPTINVNASAPSVKEREPLIISWSVTGFVLDAPGIGNAPEQGRGHVHLDVDGSNYAAIAADSITITDLPKGNHTIRVSLHNNDHTPLSPEVGDAVVVEITPGPPRTEAPLDLSLAYGAAAAILIGAVAIVALALRRKRRGDGAGHR